MSVVTLPMADQCFVIYDLPWESYENILETFGDRRLRHTYVEGMLEIVSPSMDHESTKCMLGSFVEILSRVYGLPRISIGSTTMRKEHWRRGLEPDEGFYLGQKNVAPMLGRRQFDPDRDPPPNLLVEVDITTNSTDRIEFYRRLGVKEVWRFKDREVAIYRLTKGGEYRQVRHSRFFPVATAADLSRFLAMQRTTDDTTIEVEFEKWAREQRDLNGEKA